MDTSLGSESKSCPLVHTTVGTVISSKLKRGGVAWKTWSTTGMNVWDNTANFKHAFAIFLPAKFTLEVPKPIRREVPLLVFSVCACRAGMTQLMAQPKQKCLLSGQKVTAGYLPSHLGITGQEPTTRQKMIVCLWTNPHLGPFGVLVSPRRRTWSS